MTTGHAPDDWLDIPPPPFAPDGEPEGDGSAAAAEAQAAAVGEMPTGEIQVVDVPDAVGGEPTGKMPVIDAPAPSESDGFSTETTTHEPPAGAAGEVGQGPNAGGAGEAGGLTMTGQFRAVAAALAADLTETRAAELAGGSDQADDGLASPSGTETGSRTHAAETRSGEAADVAAGASAEPVPDADGPSSQTHAAGSRRDEATDARAGASAEATPVGEGRGSPDGGATGPRAEAAGSRAGEVAGAAAGASAVPDSGRPGSSGVVGGSRSGEAVGASAGDPAAPGLGGEELGSAGDGVDGRSGEATDAAAGGSAEPGSVGDPVGDTEERGGRGDEVDVAGAVEVPEPPPAPRAWQVPVLRSKRDPSKPPPPDAVPARSEVEELGPRARRRIETHRYRAVKLRRQRRLAVAGLALLVTTGATLGMVGVAKVRGSTGGRYVDPQVRPDEPGYVALVTPTPTLLVVHKGSDGALSGVSLLSLHAQDEGGSVIVMPVSTVAPFADVGTTFADAYAQNGAEGVATQVELTLNITIGETVEVDDLRWATLVDPVSPISIDLDKAVGDWPAGEAQIPADQVGRFLATRTDSETELGRLDRQELFWETWLPLVKAGGRNAVPGETDVGLGRFVRGLAAGDTDVTSLPVSAAFSAEEMYGPTEEMLPDLVAHAIPYPQEPSRGSRVQTQLLNGTTQRDLTARAATSLVAGGAEIALVGNAASFAEPTTRFVYATAKLRDDAQKLRDAFGVGEVVQAPADDDAPPVDEDRIDVTVILGADALDALGG